MTEGSKVCVSFLIPFTSIWISAYPVVGLPTGWGSTAQMRLYMLNEHKERTWRAVDLEKGLNLFYDKSYDPQKPTMLITHGWFQDAQDEIIVMLVDSMFEISFYEKMNIMVLDTPYFLDSAISFISYFSPAAKIEMLGNIVGDIFNKAIQAKLIKPEYINLLGLSLGAQLCGYIGRAVMGQVHTIVGLDPAGPGFDSALQYLTKLQHVSKLDARFVHLYHTNSVTFGTYQRLGTADFEFNEGFSQPGCATSIDPKCSHKRAFYIFNDLILGNRTLIALRCDTLKQFRDCECRANAKVVLEFPINTSVEGMYFLKTGPKAPFGLGIEGITCWKDQWESLQKQEEIEKVKTAHAFFDVIERFKTRMVFLQEKKTVLVQSKPENIAVEEVITPDMEESKTKKSSSKKVEEKISILAESKTEKTISTEEKKTTQIYLDLTKHNTEKNSSKEEEENPKLVKSKPESSAEEENNPDLTMLQIKSSSEEGKPHLAMFETEISYKEEKELKTSNLALFSEKDH